MENRIPFLFCDLDSQKHTTCQPLTGRSVRANVGPQVRKHR